MGAEPVGPQTMQGKLEELEKELIEVNTNNERLQRTFNELTELQARRRRGRGRMPMLAAPCCGSRELLHACMQRGGDAKS